MRLLRKLLLPFSALYWLVTAIRNFLYDKEVYKHHVFKLPVIAVGNLSTGGTGKTPQTEYLIRLLEQQFRVATLSRGYGRKSKGYILADTSASAQTLGDEPYQFYTKFSNINVAVDADRVNGISQLLNLNPQPQIIILDDAYQHRRVKAGFYILLTAYGDIYPDDFILPAGNLRESRTGAARADVIVVTKCPTDLSMPEQQKITKKLKPKPSQKVFFTCIAYDNAVHSGRGQIGVEALKGSPKVLVAGIAKPQPFFDYLKAEGDIVKAYPDHHDFTEAEINELKQASEHKNIITTEKDYMRLKGKLPADRLFYLPIKTHFITGSNDFDNTIFNYVGKSTANR
ncbi:MAG: tetraacyldisaccharide 4'-kinase [Bacteroidota bacterium]